MRHEQLISVRMALAEDDANSATLVASLRCVEAELDWLKGITSHQAQRSSRNAAVALSSRRWR